MKKTKRNKLKIFFIFIIIILIAMRIALPYFLIDYVTKQINKIPEYKVHIGDLDVHLYRGSYTLKNLQLWKVTKDIPVPFFESSIIDLSIQWKALLQGALVAKIVTEHPIIHFVADTNNEQLTIDKQWLVIVKTLFPLNINKLTANNGEIYFQDFHGDPPFKTVMKDVHLEIDNMQRTYDKNTLLLSTFKLTAKPMGAGSFSAEGKYNPFIKLPTFYIKVRLVDLEVSNIKNFLKHYTNVDVSSGIFSLYGEAAAADGKIKGYAKPFIKNLKIGNPNEHNPIHAIYNGAVAVVAKVLENSKKKTIATDIKIEGNINDSEKSTWSIIYYLLRHAFIQALLPQIDHSVDMRDVIYEDNSKTQ
jgi:hypothetical protein